MSMTGATSELVAVAISTAGGSVNSSRPGGTSRLLANTASGAANCRTDRSAEADWNVRSGTSAAITDCAISTGPMSPERTSSNGDARAVAMGRALTGVAMGTVTWGAASGGPGSATHWSSRGSTVRSTTPFHDADLRSASLL